MSATFLAILLLAAGETPPPNAVAAPAPVLAPEQYNEAFAIGKELRCPVCQGMPIAESPSTMAQDMMKVVQRMLAEGKTRDEINAFFVERYGEWVLLDPPTTGFNGVVWVLPPTLLVLAVWLGLRHMGSLRRDSAPAGSSAAPEPTSVDPYIQAIRDEVQK